MPYSAPGPFLGAQATTGYRVSNSLRFRGSASAYLGRTPSVASNRTTYTWSGWVKRGTLGAVNLVLFGAGSTTSDIDGLQFLSDAVQFYTGGGNTGFASLITTQVFRDPSAWYHIMVAVDTTQATASNRVKIYVNGAQVTAFSSATYPNQNTTSSINNTVRHAVGAIWFGTTYVNFFDGYLAEVNFIDGQALTPSSFGENDATTGVWKAKAYTGTYTGNSFYLKFADNSGATATTIGKDSSGLGNNWTPTNISVTAGTTYDSMIDTPTPYDDGGNGVGNYAVLNPLANNAGGAGTLSNGNLGLSVSSAQMTYNRPASISVASGQWYLEAVVNSDNTQQYSQIGVIQETQVASSGALSSLSTSYGLTVSPSFANYATFQGSTITQYGTRTTGAVTAQIAFDATSGKIWIGVNNTWLGGGNPSTGTTPTYSGIASAVWYFGMFIGNTSGANNCSINFGQRPFTYTPPSGFKALNTQNLPTPTIAAGNAYMDISLWTGNQNARTITNSGAFQPDLIWTKSRSDAESHRLHDAVRGGNGTVLYELNSNTTDAEGTDTLVSGFAADGFTIAAGANSPNITSRTYIGWQWKANGAGTVNNVGTIQSNVSANATAGFSVVTWTGNTTANSTVGHGLGAPVDFAILKNRTTAGTDWVVWHRSVTSGNGKYLYLDLTNALSGPAGTPVWNSSNTTTQSSSTTFTIGANSIVNANNMLMYCFAAVAGYSAFGSYTGNGSADGPFVFTGFRPRYVLIKRTDAADNWYCQDSSRGTYNANTYDLFPNLSNAEQNSVAYNTDFLSNGFKLRTSDASINASGGKYIYAAFAENPFKYALAR